MTYNINNRTLIGALTALKERINIEFECVIPCKVVNVVDRNTVDVQPMVKILLTDSSYKSRAVYKHIPVFHNSTKSFSISFPVNKGDLGWLVACDRDINSFISSKAESEPVTCRMHSFNDSIFIPDRIAPISVSDDNQDALVIQNDSGSMYIAVKNDEIVINGLHIDTSGKITIQAGASINGVQIDSSGNITTSGTITAQGEIKTSQNVTCLDVKANGGALSLSKHNHSVQVVPATGTGATTAVPY